MEGQIPETHSVRDWLFLRRDRPMTLSQASLSHVSFWEPKRIRSSWNFPKFFKTRKNFQSHGLSEFWKFALRL